MERKKHGGQYVVDRLQHTSRELLPSISGLMPASGEEVQRICDEVQSFLAAAPDEQEEETGDEVGVEKSGRLKSKIRNFTKRFKRSKKGSS